MDFTSGQFAQMIAAALGGTAFFLLLFRMSEKASLGFLIMLIPFQIIDTRFGSLNVVMTYVAAFAYLIQGRLSKLPFFVPVLLILFAYMIAFSQSHPLARLYHVIYLVGFFSNILLFYMIYNFLLRTENWRFIIRCLLATNVLVVIYCAIQFAAGDQTFFFLGIEEFGLNPPRKDGRLVGPFKATAETAEFFTFQCLIIACILVFRPSRMLRWMAYALVSTNLLFLIATGNRGGFVTIIFGTLLFLWMYRRELGFARLARLLTGGTMLFVALGIVAVNFTEYGMLFERLEETEFSEEGIPDTRGRVWTMAWDEIVDKPILGHGPRLAITTRGNIVGDIEYVRFPHNLLLHLLYTTGIVGALMWIAFFTAMWAKLWFVRHASIDDEELATVPRMGIIILIVFFVSQLRIEFLRNSLIDYQNYLFVLFATMLACSDIVRARLQVKQRLTGFSTPPEPTDTTRRSQRGFAASRQSFE